MAFENHPNDADADEINAIAELSLDAIGCVRGDRALFNGISLSLTVGDGLHISGPNGSGKSSLLRLMAGLLRASAGEITITGQIGFASEQVALDHDKPLAKALAYWAQIDGASGQDVAGGLSAMALTPLSDIPVRMLSTGQLKRASMARIIAGNADIWLLDEPGNGLDNDALLGLENAIAKHRANGGIVVVATHQDIAMPHARTLHLGGDV